MKDIDYDELDPGIREVVRWLRARGWRTTDSGDGKSKLVEGEEVDLDCALPYPHVVIAADPETMADQARRLATELAEAGIVIGRVSPDLDPAIEASYSVGDSSATIILWHVTSDMLGGSACRVASSPPSGAGRCSWRSVGGSGASTRTTRSSNRPRATPSSAAGRPTPSARCTRRGGWGRRSGCGWPWRLRRRTARRCAVLSWRGGRSHDPIEAERPLFPVAPSGRAKWAHPECVCGTCADLATPCPVCDKTGPACVVGVLSSLMCDECVVADARRAK